MNPVPQGWATAGVFEIASLHDSLRVPLNAAERATMKGNYPYYGANGLVDHVGDYRFDGHFVLLAEDGGYFDNPLREVAYEAAGRFWVNNHAHILQPLGGIPHAFLKGVLNATNWLPYVGGSTRLKLTQGGLQQVPIAVPPLPEQQRIVAKIDSLSAKSARARLDHIPRLVEKYKQAILAAAYDEASRKSDDTSSLGSIAAEVRNGLSKKPANTPPGIPILRISAVRERQVRLKERRYYPSVEVPRASLLKNGDLLFTRYNGNPNLTALCGMVRDLDEELTYPDKLIRIQCRSGVLPAFIEIICGAPQSRIWVSPHIKSAAGQHGISGADLKRMPIPLPTLQEQTDIVRRIETALTWIDRLAKEVNSARKLVDHLDQAVLSKAFRGELVPQDPNDEPASVLLERIKAERGAGVGVKRARRSPAKA